MADGNSDRFLKLNEDDIIKPFKSTDNDLNGFLKDKAKEYHKGLLATTYIIENDIKVKAYFNIFNDSLRMEEVVFPSKSQKKRFPRDLLHSKRSLATYPAIKIGRLAVCENEKGYGKLIIQWIIQFAIDLNKQVGCKFITVDAYSASTGFYEKQGFDYFNDKDIADKTRHMYLDIAPYVNADNEQATA